MVGPIQHEWVLTDSDPAGAGGPQRRRMLLAGQPDVSLVLRALTLLRWLALAGQLGAILISQWWLGLDLPIGLLLALMSVTAGTNIALMIALSQSDALPRVLVPLVLLLDVLLLTGMLAVTGGYTNPFYELYLIHIAMGVVVLERRWLWTLVVVTLLGYGMQFHFYLPMRWLGDEPRTMLNIGAWCSLGITAVLTAFFIGNLRQAVRTRESQVAAMRQNIARSQKLASLTTLAAGAAHELGTPLGTIALVAKELEHAAAATTADPHAPRTLADIQLIRQQVDRCRRILDRMNVENTQSHDDPPRPIDIADLIDELRADLTPAQQRQLQVAMDADLPVITAPRESLVQAIGILLHNGLDAGESLDQPVKLAIQCQDNLVRISVTDHGPGMDAAALRRAGEPFVTTKAPDRGMGLGLFLARLIAEHLQGRLILRSAPGQGTQAVLEFPLDLQSH